MADVPPLRSPETRPNKLPGQLTHFIGRERELADARAVLARSRLVTLTGPGGTGKTRFAVQLAADVLDRYEDGAFFVGLATVFDPDLVIPATAQVLGVPDVRGRPPLESLKDHLRDKSMLLLLDNLEHVLAAGPRLTELLAACPSVTMLATSRVALRLTGEQEIQVAPLTLPYLGNGESDPSGLASAVARSEAVQLFVERARAVQPDFALTGGNAVAVAEVCRRLDGLPLAIELAAARVRLLPPESMLARLGGRSERDVLGTGVTGAPVTTGAIVAGPQSPESPALRFLTGGARDLPARQQTLRDTIGWSYDLLTPNEQALFRRLAVFVGGCTLDAAEAIGTAEVGDRRWALAPDEVLDGVESLIAKSLLRHMGAVGGSPRITMLETIREFGLEQLARAGELHALRRWHAGYLLDLAERAEPGLRGHDQMTWLDRLEAEHDNLRAALEWSLAATPGDDVALRLAGALAWFWASRGYGTEGRRWLERALARPTDRAEARLKAHYGAGWLAHVQRDGHAAHGQLEPALVLARALGDTWATAWTLHLLGRVAYFGGEAATARELGEQSLAAAHAAGDEWLIAWALHLLALAAHIATDYHTARAHYVEALTIRRRLGFREGIAVCVNLLAMIAYREGDYGAAFALARDSLLTMREMRAYCWIHNGLAIFATLAAVLRQPGRAVRLAGATAAFGESVDVPPIPLVEEMLGQAVDAARRALGETPYALAWAEGRGLSLDEAIAEALAVEAAPPTESPAARTESATVPSATSAGLTEREAAVLRLIAAGRTTREIARELFVSVPTVERHITHLYGKIGARGRADAAAYALKQGLV